MSDVTIPVAIVTGGAAAITAMIKFLPRRAVSHNGYMKKEVCDERSKRIEDKIDGVIEDLKSIKQHMNIS